MTTQAGTSRLETQRMLAILVRGICGRPVCIELFELLDAEGPVSLSKSGKWVALTELGHRVAWELLMRRRARSVIINSGGVGTGWAVETPLSTVGPYRTSSKGCI